MQVVVLAFYSLPDAIQPSHRPPALERLLRTLALLPRGINVDLDLVVDSGQRRGVVLVPQGLVPASVLVVDLPELVLVVVCMCVQPLAPAQLDELVFQGAILGDKLVVVGGAPSPQANVESILWNSRSVGGGFRLAGVRVESRGESLLERAQPEGPDAKGVGGVVDEFVGLVVRQGEVLDDEAGRFS